MSKRPAGRLGFVRSLTAFLTVVVYLGSSTIRAADASHLLSTLTAQRGKIVYVLFLDSHEERVVLVDATNKELTLQNARGQQRVPVADIRSVSQRRSGVIGGLAGGAVIGFLVGAMTASSEGCLGSKPCTGSSMGSGLVAGALIGALVGSRHTELVVLYERDR